MIVKIQAPIESNRKSPPALVYNEDRSFLTETKLDEDLKKLMAGRLKAFFNIRLSDDEENFNILCEAEWQDW